MIPDWLLRKHDLFNLNVQFANGATVRYPRYKVPCCERCNRNLGRLIEEPVSRLLDGGFDALRAELSGEAGGRTWGLLYLWLSLIYFKTHYKDLFLRDDLKLPHPPANGRYCSHCGHE